MPRISKFKKTARQRAQSAVDKKYRFRRGPNRRNFKRRNVKAMVSARAPIVETKKRTMGALSGFISPTVYFSDFPCRSFLEMTQGLDGDQMTGEAIFAKYYSMKVKLNFPDEHPIDSNFRAQLVWGWRTAPLSVPNTAPAGFPAGTPTRTTITRDQINNMIISSVADGFNQNVDQMNFRDKENCRDGRGLLCWFPAS